MKSSANDEQLSVVERIYRLRKYIKALQDPQFDLNSETTTIDISLNGEGFQFPDVIPFSDHWEIKSKSLSI